MRKVILFAVLIIIFINGSSQIIKEHAFDDQSSVNMNMIRLENSGQKICIVNRTDSISYQVVFYNLNYSVFQTVTIDLSPLFIVQDYNFPSLYVSYVAESVFDQDPDIDILCQLTYYDNADAEYSQVIVFNQDGSTLFKSDVINSNAWLLNPSAANSTIRSSLVNTAEGAKMILDVYYFNEESYSYDVYDLPGSLPSVMPDQNPMYEPEGNYLRAYPVPASDLLNMEYRLAKDQNVGIVEIVDEQGRIIQRIKVNTNRGTVRVPVTNYNNGLYFLKVNTARGVPRSSKVIILK
ncbi:MAG: T9SS type A sorting domain-containing protein [Bacteroidales bacterium]|nr:T9SS type A sorting domain-containing protein [Bacteroidales bacterium]